MPANKIYQIWLLPFAFFSSSSSRPLFLYRFIFSPSPLNHILGRSRGPMSLCPSHLNSFCAPSPFSSKAPLGAQSIITEPGTPLGPCLLKRSPQHLQARPHVQLIHHCVPQAPSETTGEQRCHRRVTAVTLGHGSTQVKAKPLLSCALLSGACCPSQPSPLGTHLLSAWSRTGTPKPNPKLHQTTQTGWKDGEMAWAGVTGTLPRAASICG